MAEIKPGTEISRTPTFVEYRERSGTGFRVVRVLLQFPADPRVVCQSEVSRATRLDIQPMSISVSEMLFYVNDALKRVGRQELGLSELQDLLVP